MVDTDSPASAGGVSLTIEGGVAVITIDRPAARNAIGFATVAELDGAIATLEASDAAVVVLIGGGDRAFVSGGDLKELSAVRTHDDAVAMALRVRAALDRLAALPIPVIAALNGHALGGGAEVAVAADIRIAADDITIGFNQVTLGIMPAWGGAERLTSLIGRSRALLAVLTGTRYDAAAAERLGLLDLVVPRAEFDAKWRGLAAQIASTAPSASREIKSVIATAVPAVRDDTRELATNAFARLWTAQAHWDAVDAMTASRPPR
jgi:enoyl-CoA hydratase/carnithine racemase